MLMLHGSLMSAHVFGHFHQSTLKYADCRRSQLVDTHDWMVQESVFKHMISYDHVGTPALIMSCR